MSRPTGTTIATDMPEPSADGAIRPLPRKGPRWVLWLLWTTILVAPAFWALFLIFGITIETDFHELYQVGNWGLTTRRLDPAGLGFYPPSAMPLFMLWSSLHPMVASFTSCTVYALLYLAALRWIPAEAMRVHRTQTWHAWLFLGILMGGFLAHDIVTGQVSAIPISAVILGYVWWRQGRTWRAATAMAFGIAFKLLPMLALLFFLMKRQWKMVAATGVLTVALGLLPGLVLFGPEQVAAGWRGYYTHVAYPKSHPVDYEGRIRWTKPASFLNPSLSVTCLRWLSDYPRDRYAAFLPVVKLPQKQVQTAQRAFITGLGLISLWCCRRRPEKESPEALANQYGLVLVWMVLMSPHLAIYYMAWALWPVAVMIGIVGRRDFTQRRPEYLNGLPLWAWGALFPLSAVPVLRAAGIHPGMLLALWVVLLANVIRGKYFAVPAEEVAAPGREPAFW